MSRPSGVSPRPPAPSAGGDGGVPTLCGPGGGGRAKGLKDVRIDEEVKIAVSIALERFRYGDERGKVPEGDPAGCLTSPEPGHPWKGLPERKEGRPGPPSRARWSRPQRRGGPWAAGVSARVGCEELGVQRIALT